MKIVADNKIPFLKGAFEGIAEVVYLPGKEISSKDVIDADALLIRTRTKCDANLLDGSSVKFIATATIGYDHIDIDYCKKNSISWTNAPGCNSSSVEQYIVSVLLKLAVIKGIDLSKKTLGIIGVGNVGSKVEKAAKALGMNVLLNDPPRSREEGDAKFVDIEKLKSQSNIISLHIPFNLDGQDPTWKLADMDFISSLKPGTILINTSRGEVVDNESLKYAIESKWIKTVVLDVWENEPEIDEELLKLVSIASSHIAGYSTDGKANGTSMSVQAISRFFKLGIDDWIPSGIDAPDNSLIVIDCTGLSKLEAIHDVYERSYNVLIDNELLKENPDNFEKNRGDYRIRREPGAYSVRLNNNPYDDLGKILEDLGFSILSSEKLY